MRTIIIISFLLVSTFIKLNAQTDTINNKKYYVITKHDGAKYSGLIISQDAREVYIRTTTIGDVIIPKHEIASIEEQKSIDINLPKTEFKGKTIIASRYFITTNGLPIEKGESYILWTIFGPDFEFGISKNFGVGIMSSWIGMPIIGTAKYTFPINENFNLGVGTLLGTGSWAFPEYGLALPYSVISLGNRVNNINISFGYGALFYEGEIEGRALMSIAAILKLSNKISFVFDSFISPSLNGGLEGFGILIPGLRWQIEQKNAFQFGFTGIYVDQEFVPVPLPMVQWFRKIN